MKIVKCLIARTLVDKSPGPVTASRIKVTEQKSVDEMTKTDSERSGHLLAEVVGKSLHIYTHPSLTEMLWSSLPVLKPLSESSAELKMVFVMLKKALKLSGHVDYTSEYNVFPSWFSQVTHGLGLYAILDTSSSGLP